MACAAADRARTGELATIERLKEAWFNNEQVEFGNPTLARVELAYQESYHPLGFPLLLRSNEEEVLACARECWGARGAMFDREAIKLNVIVAEGSSDECPPTPVCRMRDHLVTNIADAENFAVVDLEGGTAFVSVTRAALREREYFRYFFLESSATAVIANRYATGLHAACVTWNGTGMLLCGDSGAGKSTLAYAAARAGWTYVTDDGSFLVLGRHDALIAGDCAQARFRPEAERFFEELQDRTPMMRAGGGKPSVELPVTRASISTSPTARVKHVVFLKRGEPTQELVRFPTEVARLYFAQRIWCMPYKPQQHLENIDGLLRNGAFELRYHSLEWAVARLRKLAEEEC